MYEVKVFFQKYVLVPAFETIFSFICDDEIINIFKLITSIMILRSLKYV